MNKQRVFTVRGTLWELGPKQMAKERHTSVCISLRACVQGMVVTDVGHLHFLRKEILFVEEEDDWGGRETRVLDYTSEYLKEQGTGSREIFGKLTSRRRPGPDGTHLDIFWPRRAWDILLTDSYRLETCLRRVQTSLERARNRFENCQANALTSVLARSARIGPGQCSDSLKRAWDGRLKPV